MYAQPGERFVLTLAYDKARYEEKEIQNLLEKMRNYLVSMIT